MVGYYEKLVSQYPIISIEDGLAEGDWQNWQLLNKKLGKKFRLWATIFLSQFGNHQKGHKKKKR